jgi:tRNA A-37 threonylcarbamoyl transferase component Bud32
MNLRQITPDRFTNSRLLLHEAPGRKLLIKAFLGDNKEHRRELEGKKLTHWKAAGFSVPQLFDLQFPEVTEPYLVMEFIAGDTLKDFLRNAATALDLRLATLADLFRLNYRRHMLVRSHHDLLLVHTDPNTDNIIVSNGDFYFIDFEHSSKKTDSTSATANEVGTFARRVIRDLGVEHSRSVVERLLVAYHYDGEIFDKVEDLTFGRPFQLLHRIKDRLRRLKNSRSVTRYDVADIVRLLRGSPMGAKPVD